MLTFFLLTLLYLIIFFFDNHLEIGTHLIELFLQFLSSTLLTSQLLGQALVR